MIPIYFAPLQGYTEDAYRRLHHNIVGGVDAYFTPFIRWEHNNVRSKDMRDIRPEFNEGVPIVPQVIVDSAKELEALVNIIASHGYKHININMGCPFPLQTRHGKGAGLLTQPETVEEICNYINQKSDIAFSVKMRLGLNDENEWKNILPILNDTPLEHITLHPRIASQQYKGTVNMNAFDEFMQQCRHPLIYNGDILTLQQVNSLESQHPNLTGIMIGRGLLAHPTLAMEYKTGKTVTDNELINIIKQIHSQLLAHYATVIPSESQQLTKIKTYWDFMENTIGRKAWKRIKKAGNMKNYLSAINDI